MAKKVNVVKDKEGKAICPYCEKEICEVKLIPVKGSLLLDRAIYACPNCSKAIPVYSYAQFR